MISSADQRHELCHLSCNEKSIGEAGILPHLFACKQSHTAHEHAQKQHGVPQLRALQVQKSTVNHQVLSNQESPLMGNIACWIVHLATPVESELQAWIDSQFNDLALQD